MARRKGVKKYRLKPQPALSNRIPAIVDMFFCAAKDSRH